TRNARCGFRSHTERFAYYASLNGNRSDLGLQTPSSAVIHDRANGFGGFSTLIYNINPNNQLRLVTSLRRDFYQIPSRPDDQASGISDVENEADAFVNFSWVHTEGPLGIDRKSTRLNSSHRTSSYAVFCLKKKISQATGGTRAAAAGSSPLWRQPSAVGVQPGEGRAQDDPHSGPVRCRGAREGHPRCRAAP